MKRILALLLLCLAPLIAFVLWPLPNAPYFEDVRAAWAPSDGALLDRHGVVLDRVRVNLGARRLGWVALKDISPALKSAVIAGEDKRFYSHGGVDWRAVIGAVRDGIFHGKARGASTITMQLASLIQPDIRAEGRTLSYKFAQIRLARAIERRWSKHQILEAYLNLLSFRGELVGIDAASRLLFGKAPSGLSEVESVLLAALLPSPSAAWERVVARACARAPHLPCADMQAMDFQSVHDEGIAPHLAAKLVHKAGDDVTTTLDGDIQRIAVKALARHVGHMAAQNMRDGAVLVADVESGEIRAYVGANTATSRAPHVDGVRALRQAGSTLKPHLYGLAVERGYITAASLLDDSLINLNTAVGLYIPQNYDRDFKGLVSARTALASSLNIPAVRTLVLTGVEAFRERLVQLGYDGIDRDGEYYGYSLALGSAEVTLEQQVAAYRALARGGLWSKLRIRTDTQVEERRIMDEAAASIINDILSDRAARIPTFGLDNALNTAFWSAVKTGTSKDLRDNWCIGFTSRYVFGVWVGNFEGDAMQDVSGVSGAAPIWHDIMMALHSEAPLAPSLPHGIERAHVRFDPPVEAPRDEVFMTGTAMAVSQALPKAGEIIEITSPANGAIVALDPDMPAGHQRIPFSARGRLDGMDFILDGERLGPADKTHLWRPRIGAHRLALRSAMGDTVAQVLFTVR